MTTLRRKLNRRKFLQVSAIALPTLTLAACGEQTATNTAPTTTAASTQAVTTTQAAASTQAVTTQATTTQAAAITQATTTQAATPTQDVTTAPPATTARAATTTAPATATQPAATTQASQVQALLPTPECVDVDDATTAQTEGPYFTASSPLRASLMEAGMTGTKLVVTGYVYSTDCKPVARAKLDFWQADDKGQYDNAGFRLRGHQFTDDNGKFSLETIMPGLYPGRTRHIHVKVQAPNQPVLTTQLYFPNEPGNQRDGIYRPELLMKMQDSAGGKLATFNFALVRR